MRRASISTHVVHVSEKVTGVRRVLYDIVGSITVAQFKGYYKKVYNVDLHGDSFGDWMNIPIRGKGFTFTEVLKYHTGCGMVEFRYIENDEYDQNRHRYLRHMFQ